MYQFNLRFVQFVAAAAVAAVTALSCTSTFPVANAFHAGHHHPRGVSSSRSPSASAGATSVQDLSLASSSSPQRSRVSRMDVHDKRFVGYDINSNHISRAPAGGAPSSSSSSSTRLYAAAKAKDDMETYRKKDIVSIVAEETGLTKTDTDLVITTFMESIVEVIAEGNKVNFVGFGTFKPSYRSARKGRNPKTGEEMDIKASTTVNFSAGKTFKDRLNE